jgi:homoaconitase/3-isopropylmalate dehydratase large subunit
VHTVKLSTPVSTIAIFILIMRNHKQVLCHVFGMMRSNVTAKDVLLQTQARTAKNSAIIRSFRPSTRLPGGMSLTCFPTPFVTDAVVKMVYNRSIT